MTTMRRLGQLALAGMVLCAIWPAQARYISADPIGVEGGLNLYGYVGGNPVNQIDPQGLAGCFVDFPDYPIRIPHTNWTTTLTPGHAGVVGYNEVTGATRYYEYGRFGSDFGSVERVLIPDLRIGADGEPAAASMEALQMALSERAGKGTRVELSCDKKIDERKIFDYAQRLMVNTDRAPYSWLPWASNTCRDFARRALDAGRP